MNNLIKNTSYLSLGQILKVLIRLFAFSVITKSLSTGQFGQVVTIIAFCELFQIFTLPGMSKPLVRSACRDLENTDNILSSKSGIRNFIAIVAILITNIAVTFMEYDETVVNLIRCYSVILFLDSLRTYIRIVFQAFEEFKYIAYSEVMQSIFYLVFVLTATWLGLGINGIIFASILSTIISFLVDYINSRKFSSFKIFGGFDLDNIFLTSAIIFTATNIMWLIISKIDIVMLSVLATNEEVGNFGVANRIIFYCVMGISVVSNVIFPPIIKNIQKGSLNILDHAYKIIGVFTLLIFGCLALAFMSESIVIVIADSRYIQAAGIINILLLFLIFNAFSVPIKLILYAFDREKLLLQIVLPLPILKVIFNYFGFKLFGINGVAYSTVMIYFIYLIVMLLVNKNILKSLSRKEFSR